MTEKNQPEDRAVSTSESRLGHKSVHIPNMMGSVNVGRAVADTVIVTPSTRNDSNVVVGSSGIVVGRDIVITHQTEQRILSEDQAFERIGAAVKLNLDQLERNIAQARNESSQFFKLSLV